MTDTLTALDRCDQCPAAALTRVQKNVSELDFCGHHFNSLSDALVSGGWTVTEDKRS